MKKNSILACVFALSLTVGMAACERRPAGTIQPAQTGNESFKVVGDYELHYNALRTDQLTAEIARAYAVERSKNQVLLNVSVLHKGANEAANTAVDAEVTVNARNLNNQVKDMQLRRFTEGSAIYYMGTVPIGGAETMVFEIKAIPSGTNNPIEATLTREFFTD